MKTKPKKVIKTCSMDEELCKKMKEISADTGASDSEIMRRAIKKFADDGQEEAMVMFNVVKLIQTINELREVIPEEQCAKLQHFTGNIMKIKGGKN